MGGEPLTHASAAAVRAAGPHELAAVLALHVAQENRPPGPATDLEEQTWQRMQETPGLVVYLAHDVGHGNGDRSAGDAPGDLGSGVVGTTTTMLMPNITYACAPTLFIEAVLVAASHRRRGIATAMLQRALADARAAGANKVQLLSHKRHATDGAHRLYTSLGFEDEAEGFRLYLGEPPANLAAATQPRPDEMPAKMPDDG